MRRRAVALAEAQSSHHSNAEQMLEDKEIEVASLKASLALEAKARRSVPRKSKTTI